MKAVFERLTPRQRSYVAAAGIAIVSLAAGYGLSMLGEDSGSSGNDAGSDPGCEEVLYWYDPMVPDQRFDEPGKSPFMDMQLVPKCAGGDAQGGGGVSIDSTLVQNFGIRTAEVEFGVLEPETSVTGTLAYNGSDMAIVQPRAGGYVQRTYGHAPQDLITRGAPIVDLLVPEWGGAQNEYLAVAATGDEALTRAARERLRLLGMPDFDHILGCQKRSPADGYHGHRTTIWRDHVARCATGNDCRDRSVPRRNQRIQSDLA